MADLGKDNKLPPTSPPALPERPTPRRFQNTPLSGGVVAPRLTPEEEQAALDEEKAAQEQDLIDAQAEEVASDAAMAALEGAFVPNGIFRHRGVGPLIYETKRGLLSVFSGDLVCHLQGPTQPIPDPPPAPEDVVLEDDWIAVSEAVLSALLFTVDYKLFPDLLEYRAARIGEERRAAAAIPPEEPPLSDAQLSAMSPIEREAYAQKRKDAELRRQRLPRSTQLPAEKRLGSPGPPKPSPKPTQLPAEPPRSSEK